MRRQEAQSTRKTSLGSLDPIEKAVVAKFRANLSDLKAVVAELGANLSDLKAVVAELGANLSDLKAVVAELGADLSDLKAVVSELRADLSDHIADSTKHITWGIPLPYGAKLWHFDGSLVSTDGISPEPGAVATLRPGEGRFGGCVAVEGGTTNLIPSNRLKFEGWAVYQGASVTVEQGYSIPGITPDGATRIQTSGGTSATKYYTGVGPGDAGTPASYRVWVRNIGDKPVWVDGNIINVSNIVYPGETKLCTGSIDAVDGVGHRQIQFEALDVDDSLDFIAYQPQIEEKPFATSFVDGTRAAGRLYVPESVWNPAQGTFACWAKSNDIGGGDYRHLTMQWAKNDLSTASRFGLFMMADGKMRFNFGTGIADAIVSPISTDDGEWHHYAATWVNSTKEIHLYVDGVKVASESVARTISNLGGRWNGVIPIGHRGYTYNNQWWNGLIDELLILPYAATPEQIQAWHNMGVPFWDPWVGQR